MATRMKVHVGVTASVGLLLACAVPAWAVSGDRSWTASLEAAYFNASAASPDGAVVFETGYSYTEGGASTVAYDAATGDELWAKYVGTGQGFAIAVSPDGSTVFIAGEVTGPGGSDMLTVAYDALSGEPQWDAALDDSSDLVDAWDGAGGVSVSPDGSQVFVTGSTYRDEIASATVAYDAQTGDPLWAKVVRGLTGCTSTGHSLVTSPDGTAVFACVEALEPTSSIGTLALDSATGAKVWLRRWAGPDDQNGQARAIAVSPDGMKVFSFGLVWSATYEEYHFGTVAYRTLSGRLSWAKRYAGPDAGRGWGEEASSMAVSPKGGSVVVTGQTNLGNGETAFATIAYRTKDGAERWKRLYDGPGEFDMAAAIGVSGSGAEVLVTGMSVGSDDAADYVTIAYSVADGATNWAKRFRPGSGPSTLAITPSSVVVSGQGGGGDAATVAYAI